LLGGVEIAEGTLQVGGKLTSDIHIAAGATLFATESQVIGTVTVDEGGIWDKNPPASWVGPAGDPNDDGDWHVADNWSTGAVPTIATLFKPTGQGSSETNTRTIFVAADNPVSVDTINTPTGSWPYTNMVQVDSQFTVGQWNMPHDGAMHLGIAEDATFTLGKDLPNTWQLSRLPVLHGSGAFVKVGTGTVEVPAFGCPGDDWTGTMDIQEGTLYLGGYTRLGNSSMLTVHSGAMYSIGNPDWDRPMGLGVTLNGTGISGEGALKCSTDKGMLSSASLALPTDSTINVSNAAGVLTFTGAVSGDGILTKIGAGKLAINGTCTAAGIVVNEGSFGGTGTVSDLTMAPGSTLAPGGSIGTLTADAAVLGGINWDFQINDARGDSAEGNWDMLMVGNTLTLTATVEEPITVKILSQTPDGDVGPMANFDAADSYSWTIASSVNIEGNIEGFEPSAFVIDTSLLYNDPEAKGFRVVRTGNELRLVYGTLLDGDANEDCKVNILDLLFIRNRLNQSIGTGDNWKADVNGDDKINILDLIYVRNRLNTSC